MSSNPIFCPKCHTLLLEAAQCPKCGWRRPARPPGQDRRLLWEIRFVEGISSGLTYAEGVLVFVDGAGRLHAFDVATREEAWAKPVDLGAWRVHEKVAVAEGKVVFGPTEETPLPEADKAVVALDFRSGAEVWRRPLAERSLSDPLIAHNQVFVATSSNKALALNLDDGRVVWEQSLPGIFTAAPATCENLVFFGSDRGILTALRRADGALAWRYQVEPFGSWPESIPYTPVVADGVLYFTCWNRKTYALDARTGDVIWISEPTKKRPPMTPPLVTADMVYLAAHDRYVYALDRATGQERWRAQLPRRSEVQPLLAGDTLVVAARDHHVYALDAATGEVQEAPLLTTGGKVSKAWAFDGAILYLADDLGKLYALRLVEPAETTATPEALMEAGQWEKAAIAWALAGEYGRAAAIYAEQLGQPFKAAQLYDKAGAPLLAAQQYELAGKTQRALERYRQAQAWDKVALLSEKMGDYLAAAQAYEHLGLLAKAGEYYFKLGNHAQAVALYEQAARKARDRGNEKEAQDYLEWAVVMYTKYLSQPAKAVVLLDEFGQKERAKELLQSIPGWKDEPTLTKLLRKVVTKPQDRARAYERAGAPLLAAKEYVEAGEHAKAADLLARSGEFKLAAEQYLKANMPARAAEMMVRMQNWDEAAELYLKANQLQDALRAYLQAGDIRHAAELLERLGQWARAAEKWEYLGKWERAAQAWERADDFVRAAKAWITEGETIRAAEDFEKAAQRHGLHHPTDTETLAAYYEQAMEQYRLSGVKNKADFCDSRRRYYRRQPLIQVNAIHIHEALKVGEWGKLDVVIANRGWGQAQDIRIRVAAQYFELDTSRLEKAVGLGVGVQTRYTLWLKPRDAGTVPLHLTISYLDRKGRPMPELTYDADVRVHHADSKTSTHQVIQVQGDYISGEHIHKQVGDRVEIRRGDRGITLEEGSASAGPVPKPSVPTIQCAYCGTEQPATNPRCENSRCGAPFIQCPNCELYQPKDERSPEQFCQFCGARL